MPNANPKMTDGEKMVWAAVYAFHIVNGDGISTNAAVQAWRAIQGLRFSINLSAFAPEADEMWLEMVGMNRSPEGTLYQ